MTTPSGRDRDTHATQLAQWSRPGAASLLRARVALVLSGVLLIPQAALIAICMQRVFMQGEATQHVVVSLAWLAGVMIARALLATLARAQADDAVERIRTALRTELVPRMFARGPRWMRTQRGGELVETLTGHVDALEGYFAGFLTTRSEVTWVPLAILIAVFCVDRVVGMILLLTLPLAPIFMMLVGWGAEAASRQQLRALARLGGHFADRVRGLGVIRVYERGDAELQGIAHAAEGVRERSLKVLRIAFMSSAVLEFFASVSVAMIALYLGLSYLGMIHMRAAPLDLATGVFCLLLAPEFYAPLRRLATHYHDRASARASVEEIQRILEAEGDHVPIPVAHDDARASAPAIHLRALSLRASAAMPPVCAPLDLDISPGEHIALIGPSGIGKTTLLEALTGWLPPASGEIAFEHAARIGYAPQRPFLFHGSIAGNMRIAAPDASDADIERAARAAQVMRFAERLPDGLHTIIGERGFGLSGGEARRVALARVFLQDPRVILLDEPTAFLDPATEAAVLASLREFARGRTVIMATHSVAAMASADRIVRFQPFVCEARA